MNRDLTVGKPEAVLWRFCMPLFGSIIFQQLYNIADSLVAGKFIGENALAAVGNSYEITLIFIAFAFGCNMGCSVVVSNLFGAKNYRKMKTAVYTSCIFSAAVCLVLMAVGIGGAGILLRLIRTRRKSLLTPNCIWIFMPGDFPLSFSIILPLGSFPLWGISKLLFIFLQCPLCPILVWIFGL